MDEDLDRIRRAVLDWYGEHQRDLPWRTDRGEAIDPYRIWLSEVMLQQTRVDTVRPYFDRWLKMFPDIPSLAAASEDNVLKAWEGLGYYSRARHFHAAVREVVDRFGGDVPADMEAFRALPGVGRYTAGAVMSIAFDQETPVVDGNVRRVYARLFDQAEPREAEVWGFAGQLVRGQRPGDLNQGLMELGATVCTPRSPACMACPLSGHCRSLESGTVAVRPAPRRRATRPTEHYGVAVVTRGDGAVLIVRRPPGGRLGGLWEFPSARFAVEERPEFAVRQAASGAVGHGGVRVGEWLGSVKHEFTHVRVVYEVFEALVADTPVRRRAGLREGSAWAFPDDLDTYALSRAQRRIIEIIARSKGDDVAGPPRPPQPGS